MRFLRSTLILGSLAGLSACGPATGGFKNLSVKMSGESSSGIMKVSAYDVNLHPMNKTVCEPFGGGGSPTPEKGILASLFYVGAGGATYNNVADYVTNATRSRQKLFFSDLNVPTRMFTEGFSTQTTDVVKNDLGEKLIEWFAIQFQTSLMLSGEMPEGEYELSSLGDDGVVVKAKIDGAWKTIINNDGQHPTRMGCASQLVHLTRGTALPLEISYYQGPRYHISNVLLWKKSDASQLGHDAQCGQSGNQHFFDPNQQSNPLQPFKDLQARGWQVVGADNFFVPMESVYNPCVANAVDPVISSFRVTETFTNDLSVAWTTDIPATTQVLVTDAATGEQILTDTDNLMRTTHQVRLGSLKAGTSYKLQAISISESLGKVMSPELMAQTLE